VDTFTHDANGNLTSKGTGSGATSLTYDDENRLISVSSGAAYRSDFVYDGLGRMRVRREYTWGAETEVPKSGMTLSGSGTGWGWDYPYAKDSLSTDPGWHNASYNSTNEYLRVDLGSQRTVGHVAYLPRVMNSPADSSWSGVYRLYEIYVTDDASGNPDNWGAPVAAGQWTWPNLQERKDVYFTPKSGRYVYFRRVTAYGWYTEMGYPGYANANEIWVYEPPNWQLASETRYIYDGKRVIQERDGNNVPTVTYTRGKDLSGSLEGAGGIGGLLARSHDYSGGSWSTHNFYHADGNGNITYLVNSAQAMVANYKYDPYGRTISSSGSLASANVYRFSSKEFHANSGMYYYLYRFYDPTLQRWVNRDPIGESGGGNLFRFCDNARSGTIDLFGLFGRGRPPVWRPPTVLHSPKGEENDCPPRPPCLGHNNFPGGIWDGNGGTFDYGALDEPPTHPWPGLMLNDPRKQLCPSRPPLHRNTDSPENRVTETRLHRNTGNLPGCRVQVAGLPACLPALTFENAR
jgi:RHS repeat-associated protein